MAGNIKTATIILISSFKTSKMEMEDPNLIATLIPVDNKKRAENAFCHKDNEIRYLPPTHGIPEGPTISTREATPAQEQSNDDHREYDSTHRLQLTFDKKPKDPTKGYCFGTNLQKCDVLLGDRGAHGISGLHFYITFDDIFDDGKHLILRDKSTNGTAVSYSGQASKEVRHDFTWILDLKREEGKWEVEVHVQGLEFKVELASHETCQAKYNEKVEDFLIYSRTAPPPLDGLELDSHRTTAQPLTPRQYPIYIRERGLGRGSFGGVDKVINVSTGAIDARKEFYEPQWAKGKERRKQQREDWLNQVRREIRIMKDNPHVSISTLQIGWRLTVPEGKHRSGRRVPRGPFALSGDAISSSRKSGESAQRKHHYCGRNHSPFFSGPQRASVPTSTRRGASRLEAGKYPC